MINGSVPDKDTENKSINSGFMSSPFADQILTADPPEADAALSLLLLIKVLHTSVKPENSE